MGHVCCPIKAQVGDGLGVNVNRIVVLGTKVFTQYRCVEGRRSCGQQQQHKPQRGTLQSYTSMYTRKMEWNLFLTCYSIKIGWSIL